MGIEIGGKPESTFNDPLGLLSDCHRRIERFLEVMTRVVEQAGGGVLAENQRQALTRCLHYFRDAAPRHTADEEESLFPRLRRAHAEAAAEALYQLEALEGDHHRADAAHVEANSLVERWLTVGALNETETQELRATLTELQRMYEAHIAVEDSEVFPLAARLLGDMELHRIGREMAARRGIDHDALPDLG